MARHQLQSVIQARLERNSLKNYFRSTLVIIAFVLSGCSSGGMPSFSGNIGGFNFNTDEVVSAFRGAGSLIESTREFSPQEEYAFGRSVSAHILSKYPAYDSARMEQYIQKVGYSLALNSDLPETFNGYHFKILDTEAVNAFAAPGGFIFVSRGLLSRLENEEMLAAVLAHEIAHVVKAHGEDAVSSANFASGISQIGGVAAKRVASKRQTSIGNTFIVGQFGQGVGKIVERILEKGYSRAQELEADEYAHLLLQRTGYSSEGLSQVLNTLNAMDNEEAGGWFDTHPALDERIELAAELAEESEADSGAVERRTRRFAQAQAAFVA